MEGVQAHTDVEPVFATAFHHVFIGTNPSGLQSWGGGERGQDPSPKSQTAPQKSLRKIAALVRENLGVLRENVGNLGEKSEVLGENSGS